MQRLQGLAHELPVALGPGDNRSVSKRDRFVWHKAARIEVDQRTESLTVETRAVRGIEREGARRHLGHADAAVHARETSREQAVAVVEGVDDDDVVGEAQRDVDRLGQSTLDARANDDPVDHDLDSVVAASIELDVILEPAELTIDPGLGEAARAQRGQLFLELALSSANDRRQDIDPRVLRIEHDHVDDPLERLARDRLAARRAMRHADAGKQQPQVIVDFGDGTDGRARIRPSGLLLDRNGRREPVDEVDVRLLHLFEELPGVGRERLDIAPLSLGVDGIEGQ